MEGVQVLRKTGNMNKLMGEDKQHEWVKFKARLLPESLENVPVIETYLVSIFGKTGRILKDWRILKHLCKDGCISIVYSPIAFCADIITVIKPLAGGKSIEVLQILRGFL